MPPFLPDTRLAMTVRFPDGQTFRWGPDEPRARDIPQDIGFSTSIPGAGFKTAGCSLLRGAGEAYPDQRLLADVDLYGAGGQTAWQGRLAEFPLDHGESYGVQPGAVGWSSHLEDDPSFREIYRDTDLSRWQGPSVQRRRSLIAALTFTDPGRQTFDPATGSPAFVQTVGPQASGPPGPLADAWYDARGIALGSLYYAWRRGVGLDNTNANYTWQAGLASDDIATSNNLSGNLRAAGPGAGTVTTSGVAKYWANVNIFYNATTGLGAAYDLEWTKLAVYGTHGLALRGTEPDAGFYLSDIIGNIVTRGAPLLNVPAGNVETNTTLVQQLAFLDPIKPADAIARVNALAFWEWGVYDDRAFFFRRPDPDRLCWRARRSDGAALRLEGDTIDQVVNGALVTYTDAQTGRRQIVGPPGTPNVDATDPLLADTSATNPVNAAGIPRKLADLQLGDPATLSGAVAIGAAFLAERNLARRAGTMTVKGHVLHPTRGMRPAWEVRAGDWITMTDDDTDVPRRIVDTSYQHSTRTNTLTLNNASNKLDAILERLNIALNGIIG
ncbi:hypothetical protein [Paraconexibacter algicola]|uniref:Uncharacterized protein n=1 Tax=Paraconexibacter algicola TaxID=2133960 RepID=A0A2T4UE20_9ACTN|nr:hypothetical protein [Paraconexibacter algicola]PTL55758.1 hypothetical protein C7Y72_19205 [Paraconexibacter algicola]